MSVSYRTLIYFLPFILLAFIVVPGPAQEPAPDEGRPSAWWYPLGNPEATRNNPVPTASQKAEDLKIKWRTGKLKNSPVLLVGGIRTAAGKNDQQIVGMEEGSNRVRILSSTGFVEKEFEIPAVASLGLNLQLTGLFNTAAPSVVPTGRPTVIGIGMKDWSVTTGIVPFGILVDGEGTPINRLRLRQLEIQKVAAYTNEANRKVSIYPIAAYTPTTETTPIGLALVSQNEFVRSNSGTSVDSMINGIRKYSLVQGRPSVFADSLGQSYFLAPKTYSAPPAFLTDGGGRLFMSLSTERYSNITPPLSIRDGTVNEVTTTDIATPTHFDISQPTAVRLANEPTLVTGATATTSHFVILTFDTSSSDTIKLSDTPIRVFAEQSVFDAEGPRIQLTTATGPGAITNYIPTPSTQTQTGWRVVVANVDGTAPGFGDPDIITTQQFVNNPGNELVLTTQPNGSGGNGKNWVYVFRYNAKVAAKISRAAFHSFARELLSGEVIASGDLVADTENREELLLADGKTLSVLQLKPYNLYEQIESTIESENKPFYFLDTFNFGSDIVSVAIADLEGDGENDIIVCTQDSTYAIGKVQPNPYPFNLDPNPFNRDYCPSDTINLSWKRNVGGEGEPISVKIIGESEFGPISQSQISGDKLTFAPTSLSPTFKPGNYRVVISNSNYPYISDTSDFFTVTESALSQLDFPNSQPYSIGDEVTDIITLHCIDNIHLQRSVGDSVSWMDLTPPLTIIDASHVSFSDTVMCPTILGCGIGEDQVIYYRAVSSTDTTAARKIEVASARFDFTINSGLSRNRSISWRPSDLSCSTLSLSLSGDKGKTWHSLGTVSSSSGTFTFSVPDEILDSVLICAQCSDPGECSYGVQRFNVASIELGNYVYPNPFNPELGGSTGLGAEIVFLLKTPSFVTITIYDASRTIVRELVKSEDRPAGRNRGFFWDGKNSHGEYVANGTYICLISLSSGEQINLPISVVKRR